MRRPWRSPEATARRGREATRRRDHGDPPAPVVVLRPAESGRALPDATDAVQLLLDHQAGLFQTVTGPLAELPGWLQAAGWGLLSASGLLLGAVGGYYTWLQRTTIARAMTFAAGVLLAVVAVDLVIEARGVASLHSAVMGLLCGAAVFSSVLQVLSH